jgi:hypothetical protein
LEMNCAVSRAFLPAMENAQLCRKQRVTYWEEGNVRTDKKGIWNMKIQRQIGPESIRGFIEDQASSSSYDLAPSYPPPPSPVSKVDRRHTGRLRKRNNLQTGEGLRGWGRS